ncbi:MAG: stalk domain-containing protein [Armatimonadota bacterium]
MEFGKTESRKVGARLTVIAAAMVLVCGALAPVLLAHGRCSHHCDAHCDHWPGPANLAQTGAPRQAFIVVDGKRITARGRVVDGKVMVPARAIGEALEMEVQWERATRTVKFSKRPDVPRTARKQIAP